MHSRKRFVWKKFKGGNKFTTVAKGIKKKNAFCPKDKYRRATVRPKKGKNVAGGTPIKFAVGVVADTVLVCEPVKKYIDMRGPVQPAPQRLSKNGKPLGRKRTKPPRKKQFDGGAYKFFLDELCTKARKVLKVPAHQPIRLLQDGFGAHWTKECRDAMRQHNVDPLEDYPARSPGCNAAENLFGTATLEFDKETINNRPPNAAACVQRFRGICNTIAARGDLSKTARSMPARLKRIVDAQGGPTKD